jgi:pimeloyl-ACP methyl ester carboxylesterase
VDLPGGDSSVPGFDQITLTDWIDCIVNAVEAFPSRRLAFVAHSLGGVSMRAAAATLTDRVGALVFVSAVVPADGQSALEAFEVGADLLGSDGRFHAPPAEAARVSLCNDMGDADAETVIARLNDEPGRPLSTPVARPDLPKVRTIYVRPTLDQGVPWAMQDRMITNLGGAEEIVVEAGHDVILSNPQSVADILLAL